jgi:hypothetical protein
MPRRALALFVIPNAGINQERIAGTTNQEGLHGEYQVARDWLQTPGLQPGFMWHPIFGRGFGEESHGIKIGLLGLDNTVDLELAKLPLQHYISP